MSNEGETESKPNEPRGYWSDVRLKTELRKREIIEEKDYCVKRVEAAAYRLRVGPEVYVTPQPGDNDARSRAKRRLKDREAVVIPSGQFAILCTEERLKIPINVTAFIGLRLRPKLRGLINVSGFHAEPGYEGRLLFSVFNAGPGEVHVARGDDWFMISFLDLDCAAEKPRDPCAGFDGIPTEFTSALASEFPTIKALEAKIGTVEREQTIMRWAAALILTALIAFGAKQCSADSGHQATAQIPHSRERPV
jgi:dCTP deaminase